MAKAKTKTMHNDVVAIKQLVNFAVRRKLIRENPLADLKLSQPKRTPQPFWTRDQVESIINAASWRYPALFHFLADTDMRIGEARWLTWEDIDFANEAVTYDPRKAGSRNPTISASSESARIFVGCRTNSIENRPEFLRRRCRLAT